MKCSEIAAAIEKTADKAFAYARDNVGFLCGDADKPVTGILLTLDADENVVLEAARLGCNLIIGHHPILYHGTKTLLPSSPDARTVEKLFLHGITYYAAHTNLDIARGGLNDLLAEKLGLSDTRYLETVEVAGEGIGRIGTVTPQTAHAFAKRAKELLGAPAVRFCGDAEREITRVAVNTGGGASLFEAALEAGADVFVSGDFSYPQLRECVGRGMCVVDIDHYSTEVICCELFERLLKAALGSACPKLYVSKENKNINTFIV